MNDVPLSRMSDGRDVFAAEENVLIPSRRRRRKRLANPFSPPSPGAQLREDVGQVSC